jgi:nucleotide-binding universal stress UspA family protein
MVAPPRSRHGLRTVPHDPLDITPDPHGPVVGVADGGALGNAPVHLASRLARALGRPCLATTVVPAPSPGAPPVEADAVARGRRLLRQAARDVRPLPATALLAGEPSGQIVALAHRERASLVVMAVPDRHAARETLLGGAWLGVAAAAPCPVVLIPPGVGSLDWSDGPVAAAAAGSEPSLAAAALATELGDALDAGVSHLRVPDRAYGTPVAEAMLDAAADERPQLLVVEHDGRLDGVVPDLAREGACPLVAVPGPGGGDDPDDDGRGGERIAPRAPGTLVAAGA